jgi:predicted component of type VI protein secretion system
MFESVQKKLAKIQSRIFSSFVCQTMPSYVASRLVEGNFSAKIRFLGLAGFPPRMPRHVTREANGEWRRETPLQHFFPHRSVLLTYMLLFCVGTDH